MPLIMYFGSKISNNMTVTPEGYLICANVPIGRTGFMDYLGEELGIEEMRGQIVKVYRSPEELFSKATIASFEGKSVTNNHPSNNIDLNTVSSLERGHVENVHRDGDFLIADLYIKEAGLIAEVQNGKREVSCGYDCLWIPIDKGRYEQKEIVGNHVAVVQNGRAGSHVAIKDSSPNKSSEGDKKMNKKKMSKTFLAALGLKHFAQDAEPDEIAEAMDALNEEEEKKETKDAEPVTEKEEKKEEVKDAETVPEWAKQLMADVKELKAAEKKEAKVADDAKSLMDALESDLTGEKEAKDADPAKEEKKEEVKDSDEVEKSKVADSALRKIVQDMKPIIMAIPDEKIRLETAKMFNATVRDASASKSNGYANILSTVSSNRQSAMDSVSYQKQTMSEAAEKSCAAWKLAGEARKNNK